MKRVKVTFKAFSAHRWVGIGVLCLLLLPLASKAKEYERSVNLEFEAIDGATGYDVRIQRLLSGEKKKSPVTFNLKEPKWEATVKYGTYELSLRTYDDRGVPGDWSEAMEFVVRPHAPELISPKPQQKILTHQGKRFRVPFEWKPVEGAAKYELLITDDQGKTMSHKAERTAKKDLDLNVGRSYQWHVVAYLANGLKGEQRETPDVFHLIGKPLDPPDVDEPPSKFPQKITWDPPEHADSYTYGLYYKKKNNQWKLVESKQGLSAPEAPFNLAYPTGEYKIKVRAEGKGRMPSKLASKNFMVQGGLRSPAAIEAAQLKDSLSKPTNFYAIASYFITQMEYSGDRYETGKRSSFQGLGGTGRLGVGYQRPFQQWGAFGIVDLGGINISGENYTFASAELHGTWQFNLTQFSIFQTSTGLYMKELPELQGNATTGVTGVSKAQNMGPHLGFKYWIPLNHRYGLQFNGRAYYSLLGSAPNGKEIQPSLSYQAGVLGSMKLNKQFMGYAGYAYRVDQSTYSADPEAPFSNAKNGDINLIQIQGHYLNLILEYSF